MVVAPPPVVGLNSPPEVEVNVEPSKLTPTFQVKVACGATFCSWIMPQKPVDQSLCTVRVASSWLVVQRPLLQTPLRQSLLALQCWPIRQSAQVGPPQSTSVSVPFLAPSSQAGWQMPFTQ